MQAANGLEHWREFYVLLGTAGATLVALLFVAVSLGTGYLTEERASGTRAFFSPVVLHFTAVFFISAIALVPSHRGVSFAAVIAGCAAIGFAVALYATIQILRNNWTTYALDHLAYGLLPAIAYVALLVAAGLIWMHDEAALDVLAGALLVLLIVNIRNAWDLTLTMVRQQSRDR